MSTPIEPHANVMQAHAEREETQRKAARRERMIAEYRERQAALAAEAAPAAPPGGGDGDDDDDKPFDLGSLSGGPHGEHAPGAMESASRAGGVAHSLVPYPTQIAGALLDAAQEAPAALVDMSDWLGEKLNLPGDMGAIVGDEEWGIRHDVVDAIQALVPDIEEREDGGGAAARGIAQFIAGFALTRKLPGMEKLAAAGRTGQITSAALRGAVADFAVFDPHEDRLSNLIQEFPALENPVSEYLAADPDDGEAEGRFKNALEGLGLGVALDGLFLGVRAIRNARRGAAEVTEPFESMAREVEVLDERVTLQKQRFDELLGDPEAPIFDITPARVSPDEIAESGATGSARAPAAAARGAKGEEGAEYVINWSRIDEADDVKAIMQDIANASKEEIDAVRGPKMRFAQVEAEAGEMNAFEVLKHRRELNGAALPPAEATALRALFVTSGRKVRELAAAVRADPGSEINQIAFRKMMSIHNLIQAEALADQAAAARTFAARRIPVGDTPEFMQQMEELTGLYATGTDTLDIADRVLRYERMGRQDAIAPFVYGTPWAKTQDGIAQLWYLSLLSGPHTHARNFISNTTVLPLQVMERRVASFLSQHGGSGEVATEEAAAMLTGMWEGIRKALRVSAAGRQVLRDGLEQPAFAGDAIRENADEFGTFYQSLATGRSGFGSGKVDERVLGAFDPEKWEMSRTTPMGAVMSVFDTATAMPTRALAAGDEIFKTANFMAELHAQATRRVAAEVKAGRIAPDDYLDEVTRLVNEPDKAMRLQAMQFADESTFTNTPPRGSTIHRAMRSLANIPVVGRVTMAFVRTPYNIGRFTFRRTPIALAMRSYRDAIEAGGREAELARAQMLTGTALLAVFTDLALQGRLTGNGPPDSKERAHLRRMGWRPNSIMLGSVEDDTARFYSYRGLEPVAGLLGMAANTTEILAAAAHEDDPELDELVIASSLAIANQMTAANYMQGVSGILEAMNQPELHGEDYFNRLAGSLIPQGAATFTYAMDPVYREVTDWQDAIRARTPGLSEGMPAVHDLHGRELTRQGPHGRTYDILSPLYASEWDPEPIDLEMQKLEMHRARPSWKQQIDGVQVDLSRYPGAYQHFVKQAGDGLTGEAPGMIQRGQYVSDGGTRLQELNSLVSGTHSLSGWYEQMGREAKIAFIRSVFQAFNDEAKDDLMREFPEIQQTVNEQLQQDWLEEYGVSADPNTVRLFR
ncbi:MAG: hypothetical protein NXI30_04525 [bacterium]|nr:hypothetical protein [bacterium]